MTYLRDYTLISTLGKVVQYNNYMYVCSEGEAMVMNADDVIKASRKLIGWCPQASSLSPQRS